MPEKDDMAYVGAIIVLYCYIDFYLRRMVEILDKADMVEEKWRGKSATLNMFKVQEAIRSTPNWSPENIIALDLIEEHRQVRNLVAHFLIRRFANEDAYLFMTKSAADYRQVFGTDMPETGALTAVVDGEQLRKVIKIIEGLLEWLATAVGTLDVPLQPGRGDEARHGGHGPDSRDPKPLARPRDMYEPDLHIETLKLKARNFR